jgi:hypothetical protein
LWLFLLRRLRHATTNRQLEDKIMPQESWKLVCHIPHTASGVLFVLEVSSLKAARFKRGDDVLAVLRDRKVVDLPAHNGAMKCVSIKREHRKLFPELC